MHLPYNLALSFLGFFQEKWNICPHKDLCANVSSFIHNCQKLETTQLSTEWDTIQQQKGTNCWCATIWMSFKSMMLSERSQTQKTINVWLYLYDTVENVGLGTEIRSVAAKHGNDIDHRMATFYIIEISHVLTVLVVIGLYMIVIVYEF